MNRPASTSSDPVSTPESVHSSSSRPILRKWADLRFFTLMGKISAIYLLLVVLMLVANLVFTTPAKFFEVMRRPEIQSATRLTVISCTLSAMLSVVVGTPLAYLLSRFRFRLRWLIDTLVDIPIVLPPLVLGLSLLILFHLKFGGWQLEAWLRDDLHFPVTYQRNAVVLAQFSVACAFAVRTMRVTFDQIHPRAEDVARTLGCTRMQAFLLVALPQSWRGFTAAATIAWARSLGEFGPIMVFAGATRNRTEVLSTSVFLELSVGSLDAAVAVSLLMVAVAMVVLLLLRALGAGVTA
ncbi:MAG: ABC transporter permease subunit [Planctomycetaceae bacterium]|nr:ABC transporter permease subunit [Planctomycetaceae bacterium]